MKIDSKDSFQSLKELQVENKIYKIFSLKEAEKNGLQEISKLPKSLKTVHMKALQYKAPDARLARHYDNEKNTSLPRQFDNTEEKPFPLSVINLAKTIS